jgi:hypothetical protein
VLSDEAARADATASHLEGRLAARDALAGESLALLVTLAATGSRRREPTHRPAKATKPAGGLGCLSRRGSLNPAVGSVDDVWIAKAILWSTRRKSVSLIHIPDTLESAGTESPPRSAEFPALAGGGSSGLRGQ